MPQCQFLFIMSVYCRKVPKMKVLEKIWKNHGNSKRPEDPRSQKLRWRRPRGWPHPPQARAWAWWGHLGHRLASPFRLFISSEGKPLKTPINFPRKVPQLRRHRRQVSGFRTSCSGTLPGWGLTPGSHLHRVHRLHFYSMMVCE